MSREELEEAIPTDGHAAKSGDCIKMMDGFEVCLGKTYSFLVNGRQIIGTVDSVDPVTRRIAVKTGRGRALIVLKKVSTVEEIS
jgi:hypothetical protein